MGRGGEKQKKKKKKRPMRDFGIIIIYYSMVKNGNIDKGGLIGPICVTKFPVHFEWDFPFPPSVRIPSFSIKTCAFFRRESLSGRLSAAFHLTLIVLQLLMRKKYQVTAED